MSDSNGSTATAGIGRPRLAPPSSFVDTELMKALSDEMRVRIFAYLCDHTASVAELAAYLGAPESNVRYHVDELRNGGWIADDPSVLGKGFHYRAIRGMVIEPAAWERLPEAAKQKIAVHMLRNLYADAGASIAAGYMLRPGIYMSLTPMVLDAQAKGDARRVLERALKELLGIQTESDDRRRKDGADDSSATSLTVAMLGFESLRDPAEGARAQETMRL
ncbi:MAG TPA: winged helix-turn-helix domain-containing protein [Solirubrobacterales bacterium]|nr:winged helix-turn-helix domain-containing protein [Solirubrobacterales bacterium]